MALWFNPDDWPKVEQFFENQRLYLNGFQDGEEKGFEKGYKYGYEFATQIVNNVNIKKLKQELAIKMWKDIHSEEVITKCLDMSTSEFEKLFEKMEI